MPLSRRKGVPVLESGRGRDFLPGAFAPQLSAVFSFDVADLRDSETLLAKLPAWFDDDNEHQPHMGLKMLSPQQFRRLHTN